MSNPWKSEPLEKEVIESGLMCYMRRHHSLGHWCAYVGVPKGHKYYDKSYDDVPVNVHGGLTYGANRVPGRQPDGFYYFGFDCAHAGDLVPFIAEKTPERHADEVYRDMGYVEREVRSLAKQLAEIGVMQDDG